MTKTIYSCRPVTGNMLEQLTMSEQAALGAEPYERGVRLQPDDGFEDDVQGDRLPTVS